MRKIKQGDQVIVIAGRDKGKTGSVSRILKDGRLMVDSINIVKKHVKANPNQNIAGGIIDVEAPIQYSNVAIYNAGTSKADRVGFRYLEDGKKVRVFKSNGEVIDA